MLAIAAMRGLTALGLRVPDDMSVAGFDGITVGEWITPNLATIVQPAEEMGGQALHHLLERVNGQASALHLTLPYRLRSGESWGPPREQSILKPSEKTA
jgi:DNA-binding LacI/PurR family transcriptional regulator